MAVGEWYIADGRLGNEGILSSVTLATRSEDKDATACKVPAGIVGQNERKVRTI